MSISMSHYHFSMSILTFCLIFQLFYLIIWILSHIYDLLPHNFDFLYHKKHNNLQKHDLFSYVVKMCFIGLGVDSKGPLQPCLLL